MGSAVREANSVLCALFGKWIHCGCAGAKMVAANGKTIDCGICEGNIGKVVEREEKLCHVEDVRLL